MNDAAWQAAAPIITALGVLATTVTTIILLLRTSRVEGKVDVVHDLTNSKMEEVKAELAAARLEIAALIKARDDK